MRGMKAQNLLSRREDVADGAFVELVLWQLPEPVPGCTHPYKYRLAYVVEDACVVRFDNERGRGDHWHYGSLTGTFAFSSVHALLADFQKMIARWNHENSRD